MKNSNHFKILSFLLSTAYFLSACGGTLPQSTTSVKASNGQANLVAFTGIVEAMNGSQWTVSGQQMTVDQQASLDPNITVGDRVRVEASVSAEGTVAVLKVETSANDDIISTPLATASNVPDPIGRSTPDARIAPALSSAPNPSSTDVGGNNENEVFGTVEAVGVDTITVNGVAYILAGFTEIKDAIVVGDQVKLHVILYADGTLAVREIEKSEALGDNNSNDNSDNDSDSDSNDNDGGSGNNSGSGDG